DPCREHPERACTQQADRHAKLARRRPRHELTERHGIGEAGFGQPAAAFDELGAEIANMRDWTAERGAAEAQESQKHFPNQSSPSPCGRGGGGGGVELRVAITHIVFFTNRPPSMMAAMLRPSPRNTEMSRYGSPST